MLNFLKSEQIDAPLIITGHPRSGTSLVAGLVHKLGYSYGPEKWIKKADTHNTTGYYECLPVMKVSNNILHEMGGDFHDLPILEGQWFKQFPKEKEKLIKIVKRGKLDYFKDNKAMVLSDFYSDTFPDARWIFVTRNLESSFKSRFGEKISLERWRQIWTARQERWDYCSASKNALNVKFEDLIANPEEGLIKISAYLDVELDDLKRNACLGFFK